MCDAPPAVAKEKDEIPPLPSPLPSRPRRSISTGPLIQTPPPPLRQSIGGEPKSISATDYGSSSTTTADQDNDEQAARHQHHHLRKPSGDVPEHSHIDPKTFPSRPSSLLGDRSVSTSIRLRRQGFQPTNTTDFAVRSIRRGSAEWHQLLRPFVADLAFRSLEYRRYHSGVSFRPYTCHAAVLFCDLSNYSGITAVIAHRGAHALSNIVNAYFGRLLNIVQRYGGDVVKFAGDAVIVVWEGAEADLPLNSLIAAQCAIEMQKTAGSHAVDGTPLSFHIHCGLCCGILESEIFAAPTHHHMQRLYHSVGGESLLEIGEAVNLAKSGQVCATESFMEHLGPKVTCTELEEGYFLIHDIHMDEDTMESIENHVEHTTSERMMRRNRTIEEEFIHPSVLALLGHGGLNPTQIAQMRNLCILFIAKTSSGSSLNWLMEVQTILDQRRCPVVQIIDDDKAVHLVAAVNLYESIPETTLKGIEVCNDLVNQQVGCAIGMASGPTFCGVTGCSKVACRWDITGGPAVRAARLMQYALANELEVAIDQSVYDNPVAAARMTMLTSDIKLKGTTYSVPVYTMSDSAKLSAFRVLETVHGNYATLAEDSSTQLECLCTTGCIHDDKVDIIVKHVMNSGGRSAVIVSGPPLAGKKIVCQRAAGYAELVPYLHLSEDSAGFLQLARTIATWFKYVDHEEINAISEKVLDHMRMHRWSRAHDECLRLVNTALQEGLKACFLIDRLQFLDDFSMSLLRGCLFARTRSNSRGSSLPNSESGSGASYPDYLGSIAFLCVHNELYNWRSAHDIANDIARSVSGASIPIVEVREAPQDELGKLFGELADMDVHNRWTNTFGDACGNCVGYLIEKAAAIRKKMSIGWAKGADGFTEITDDLKLTISPGYVKKVFSVPVTQVSPEVAMKFSQIFDELPPLMQIILKIMSIAARVTFYHLPRVVIWETLNDLIAEGVELGVFRILIEELRDMFLVKIWFDKGIEVMSFQCRALGDTAFAVSTPIQIRSIAKALLERLGSHRNEDFRVPFLLASLEIVLDPIDKGFFLEDNSSETDHVQHVVSELWRNGYNMFLRDCSGWDDGDVELWKERFDDEITDSGFGLSFADVFNETFCIQAWGQASIAQILSRTKVYMPAIALGPMGHTLSVIGRAVFHEYGKFRGYKERVHRQNTKDLKSSTIRYVAEICEVEQLLAENGFPADFDELENERTIVEKIGNPAEDSDAVILKGQWFIDTLVAKFVIDRVDRLHKLVHKLREDDVLPPIMESAQPAIYRAFRAIRKIKSDPDAAHDALMILATSNWKPKKVPEHLPILLYQSVARLRNKILKRPSAAELTVLKHQQSDIDLEAFLIVTPLLFKAHERSEFPYFRDGSNAGTLVT